MATGQTEHSGRMDLWEAAKQEARAAMDQFALKNPQGVGPDVAVAMIRLGQMVRAAAEDNGYDNEPSRS